MRGATTGKWPIPPIDSPPAGTITKCCLSNGAQHKPPSSYTKPCWPSPAYPGLRGNVLPRFLSLAGAHPFPPVADPDDPFPTLAETQAYLELIAKPIRRHIQCNVECIDVRELPGRSEEHNRWAVRLRDWNRQGAPQVTRYYDAVVLTVGWTDVPAYPCVPGLEEAKSHGLVEHCKSYRGPEPYGREARIVVVGNANSGNDVAAQLAGLRQVGKHEAILRSVRHKAWDYIVSLPDPLIKDVPPIARLAVNRNGSKVRVTLADGAVLEDVDRVIFASGYVIGKIPYVHLLNRQPLASEAGLLPQHCTDEDNWQAGHHRALASLWRPLCAPPPGSPFNTVNNPERVTSLFWQFLHARAATLAMINLAPTRIPFWTSDVQSHCLRAIWDGSMTDFPDTLERRLEYESRRIKWLVEMKEEEPDRVKASREQCIKAQMDNGETAYAPPEHAGTPSYHSLGLMIDDYGPPLRRMAIAAKPHWGNKLPDWDEHAEERKNMHKLRKVALIKRKERGIRQN